jgi:peptidoglycan/LPS O-acetylase OafA/YrhL
VNLDGAAAVTTRSVPSQGSPYFTQLDFLKCYAIALVVVVHVSATGSYLWHTVPATDWWISTAFNAFARTCVPLFLMASGATLLDTAKTEPVSRFLARRVQRIIVPLMVWSCVYLADRAGSVRFGAIVTNIETSLRAPPSAWQIPIARRLGCIDGIAHSGALGASPDRTRDRTLDMADPVSPKLHPAFKRLIPIAFVRRACT